MATGSTELLIGWCIFGVLLLAILAFCWVYVRKYQSHQESEVISTITAISSLAIALITSALLPVDIFLVSFMKNHNGTFKLCILSYFSACSCGYLLCTSIMKKRMILMEASALAFAPLDIHTNKNSTDLDKIKLLFLELGSSNGLAALSFSISSLTLIGMLAAITYTAYGMSALPLNLIKGTRNAHYERLENSEDIEEVEQQVERIMSKCKDGRPLSSKDRQALYKLKEKLRTLKRRDRHLEYHENNCWTKCCIVIRPFKIIWGILFILVALLFIVSLFLSNLDKALHSAGIDSGFIIFGTNLTNPLNMLLPVLQTVFPLDYIFITIITMYFIFTSMAGIRNMGIWFFWIRLYKIRRRRTRPQALLFLCMILLLIVLHTSYMIYSLAPQYVMYGSQKYLWENNSTQETAIGNSSASVLKDCDASAPEDQCTVTRTYLFLHKFWFFSSIYYFGNWAFIVVFVIGLIVSCCKGKKSVIEGEVEDDDSDLSDDEEHPYA
uniref:Lysosomal cobalamin transport escort protein LMBD1 n=1 Tax=Xenopus tropicalis TaxID=8364 RepID=A0A6I8S8V8_XENTR